MYYLYSSTSEYISLREEVGNLRITVERLDRENMEMRSKERVNREVTNIVENAEKKNIRGNKKSDRIGHIEKNGGLRYGRI